MIFVVSKQFNTVYLLYGKYLVNSRIFIFVIVIDGLEIKYEKIDSDQFTLIKSKRQ